MFRIFIYVAYLIICVIFAFAVADVFFVKDRSLLVISRPIPFVITLLILLVAPFLEYKRKNHVP